LHSIGKDAARTAPLAWMAIGLVTQGAATSRHKERVSKQASHEKRAEQQADARS
jgi:hypothetical protein